jgi:hypothetical protein
VATKDRDHKFTYGEFRILDAIDALSTRIDRLGAYVTKLGAKMSVEMDKLTAEVQETKTIEESAILLIQGLATRLTEIANDPAAILALADELDASQRALADAVQANTPTPPAPPTP